MNRTEKIVQDAQDVIDTLRAVRGDAFVACVCSLVNAVALMTVARNIIQGKAELDDLPAAVDQALAPMMVLITNHHGFAEAEVAQWADVIIEKGSQRG